MIAICSAEQTSSAAIVGIELPIARSEGKWKLSQNRSAEDREGVIAGLRAQGARGEAMAAMIEAAATRRED